MWARRSPSPTVAPELPGEIVFLGTPAEERGSGKAHMIRDGLFDGLDAALLFHPSDTSYVTCRLLASEDVYVTFHGFQAHAASEPWMGRNALDALILLFSAVGLWRQQLRPDVRVHGIVQEGGTAANIIPGRARGWFMVRSPREAEYLEMRDRFREMCEAAAAATGCTVEVVFDGGASTMNHNATIGDRFAANMAAYGVADQPPVRLPRQQRHGQRQPDPPDDPPLDRDLRRGHPGALDRVPRGGGIAPLGDEVTLLAATLVAQTAYELFADPVLVETAWQEFRSGDPARRPDRRASGQPGCHGSDAGRRSADATIGPARPAGRRMRTGGAPRDGPVPRGPEASPPVSEDLDVRAPRSRPRR